MSQILIYLKNLILFLNFSLYFVRNFHTWEFQLIKLKFEKVEKQDSDLNLNE